MSKSPRAVALQILSANIEIPPPPTPDLAPNSPEALAYLDSVEEFHFAGLARLMNMQLEYVEKKRSDRPPDGLLEFTSDIRCLQGWQQLAASVNKTFMDAAEATEGTATYANAAAFATLIGTLNTNRHINLWWQLDGGINTGTGSTLTLLRNAPNIIRTHEPGCSLGDIAAIVKHPQSSMLLRPLVKNSINQMMAAQSALTDETEHSSWTDIDRVLNPDEFQVRHYENGTASLDYKDFRGLTVPAGYILHETVAPIETETPVSDIISNKSKVIGCPLSLLTGRLAQFMGWSIELVEARNLWNESWPPPSS